MKVALLCVSFLGIASAVHAETITSGYAIRNVMDGSHTVTFAFSGEDFMITGGGRASPYGPCGMWCAPGGGVSRDEFSTEDRGLSGQLTRGDITTEWRGLPGLRTDVDLFFLLGASVPEVGTPAPPILTFSAPFTLTGHFLTEAEAFRLVGSGTATISLVPVQSEPGLYELREARYDFAAVPEPSAALLVLTGIAGLTAIRARRLRRSRQGRK